MIEKILFYKNGKKKIHYLKNNYSLSYYKNRQIRCFHFLKNGKKNGECLEYYRYGEIKSKIRYKNGIQHGPDLYQGWIAFVHSICMRNNKRHCIRKILLFVLRSSGDRGDDKLAKLAQALRAQLFLPINPGIGESTAADQSPRTFSMEFCSACTLSNVFPTPGA